MSFQSSALGGCSTAGPASMCTLTSMKSMGLQASVYGMNRTPASTPPHWLTASRRRCTDDLEAQKESTRHPPHVLVQKQHNGTEHGSNAETNRNTVKQSSSQLHGTTGFSETHARPPGARGSRCKPLALHGRAFLNFDLKAPEGELRGAPKRCNGDRCAGVGVRVAALQCSAVQLRGLFGCFLPGSPRFLLFRNRRLFVGPWSKMECSKDFKFVWHIRATSTR